MSAPTYTDNKIPAPQHTRLIHTTILSQNAEICNRRLASDWKVEEGGALELALKQQFLS